jgi:acetyltransferase
LLASGSRLLALDARVVLHDPKLRVDDLPKPAIRPYPSTYISTLTLTDGTPITVRPIRPDDEPMMVQFHHALSEESIYFRYFGALSFSQRTTHERLTRMCCIDYDREIALVAVHEDSAKGTSEIAAVARLIKHRSGAEAEVAVIVADAFQRQGLGTYLLGQLVNIAREEGVGRLLADILPENQVMQRVCQQLGFQLRHSQQDGSVKAERAVS